MSSDVSSADEPYAENALGVERASHLAGKTTDVETEMIYSEFLKPGTGEYPTSRREKSESAFSLMGGTILLFLVPQVPEQFCRPWPM